MKSVTNSDTLRFMFMEVLLMKAGLRVSSDWYILEKPFFYVKMFSYTVHQRYTCANFVWSTWKQERF